MANEKRLIDANAVIKQIDDYYNNSPFPHPGTTWRRGFEFAVGLLLREPTIDAVEVVYCKDCARRKQGYCSIRKDAWCASLLVGDHDFCSDGERRTDERA